jgi:hypothetical protein
MKKVPRKELPPLPLRRAEGRDTFFDVRYVDEIGQAINGLEVGFVVDGAALGEAAQRNARGRVEHRGGFCLREPTSPPSVSERHFRIAWS